jgi:hypothetical protein
MLARVSCVLVTARPRTLPMLTSMSFLSLRTKAAIPSAIAAICLATLAMPAPAQAAPATEEQVTKWWTVHLSPYDSTTESETAPMTLPADQSACISAAFNPKVGNWKRNQVGRNGYVGISDAETLALADAVSQCGAAISILSAHMEQVGILPENVTCFQNEWTARPKYLNLVFRYQVLSLRPADQDVAEFIADDKAVKTKCITPEQEQAIRQRITETLSKVGSAFPSEGTPNEQELARRAAATETIKTAATNTFANGPIRMIFTPYNSSDTNKSGQCSSETIIVDADLHANPAVQRIRVTRNTSYFEQFDNNVAAVREARWVGGSPIIGTRAKDCTADDDGSPMTWSATSTASLPQWARYEAVIPLLRTIAETGGDGWHQSGAAVGNPDVEGLSMSLGVRFGTQLPDRPAMLLTGTAKVAQIGNEKMRFAIVALSQIVTSAPNPADPNMRPIVPASIDLHFSPDISDAEQSLVDAATGKGRIFELHRTLNETTTDITVLADGSSTVNGKAGKITPAKVAAIKQLLDTSGVLDASEVGYIDEPGNAIRLFGGKDGRTGADHIDSERDPERVRMRLITDRLISIVTGKAPTASTPSKMAMKPTKKTTKKAAKPKR